MNCPACGSELTQTAAGGVTVDVCKCGCGGLWFDNFELKKFDEPHESEGEVLLEIERDQSVKVEYDGKRKCPKCGIPMTRHFHSVKRHVAVDECGSCAGIWLDVGELRGIRGLFDTEEDKAKAAQEYFDEVFGDKLAAQKAELNAKVGQAHKIANLFRFMCPSYYIPGKQNWGAF